MHRTRRPERIGTFVIAVAVGFARIAAAEQSNRPASTKTPATSAVSQTTAQVGQADQPIAVEFGPSMFGDFIIKTLDVESPTRPRWPYNPLFSAIKIGENESARPRDRVFISESGYYDLIGALQSGHRQIIGAEKTLADRSASVGLRLPLYEGNREFRNPTIDDSIVGDLSIVFKYAPEAASSQNRLVSFGLVATAPTAQLAHLRIRQSDGSVDEVHPALFQPFVGYLFGRGSFFVQGFSSVMLPTDSRTWRVLFNDIGFGYWITRDSSARLTALIPTVELHVNTPLNHRAGDDLARIQDAVDLTIGLDFLFRNRYAFGVAVVTPVTKPRLFGIEVIPRFSLAF